MPATHIILELRAGRDAEHTPESAAQLFATIPELNNSFWHQLRRQHESLSFELVVQNQTIYFLCHCPLRLAEYLEATISASFPQVMITRISGDPLP